MNCFSGLHGDQAMRDDREQKRNGVSSELKFSEGEVAHAVASWTHSIIRHSLNIQELY